MERWSGTTAIVTGCTAGIGLAITKELIKHNIIVIGLARRVEMLKSLEKEFPKKFYGKKCDLNKNEDILGAFKYLENNFGAASIIINNAGVLNPGSILELQDDIARETLQVNVGAVITICREAVKAMIAKSIEGHIINISSITGKINYPMDCISPASVYTASKHAVNTFTEDLRRELYERGTKIKASTVSPGMVETFMLEPLHYLYQGVQTLEPKDVANACITILNTPPDLLITDLILKSITEKY